MAKCPFREISIRRNDPSAKHPFDEMASATSSPIQQQVQYPIYQQNDIQQQSFYNTKSTSQVLIQIMTPTASILVYGTVSYSMQDGFQNSS
ncbi:unnamed protein product [Rhizophagus irregularis]|nr:unnamed protein product [Rhizophagus irregularis]